MSGAAGATETPRKPAHVEVRRFGDLSVEFVSPATLVERLGVSPGIR